MGCVHPESRRQYNNEGQPSIKKYLHNQITLMSNIKLPHHLFNEGMQEIRNKKQLKGQLKSIGIQEIHYIYEGQTKNNLPDGKGLLRVNNDKYQGQFRQGQIHGTGVMVHQSGFIYQGCFCQGKRQGFGTLRKQNLMVRGEWQNGVPHGKCYLKDSFLLEQSAFFIQGKASGFTILRKYNRKERYTYKGMIVKGRREQFGYSYIEGPTRNISYLGEWKEDKKSGLGIEKDRITTRYGLWRNDFFLEEQEIPWLHRSDILEIHPYEFKEEWRTEENKKLFEEDEMED